MYGMLLESVQHFVQAYYGEDAWVAVLDKAQLESAVFTTHRRYDDKIMTKLAGACSHIIRDRSQDEYMEYFGRCFVNFFSHYGYDMILRVSGRHFRDFLHGIDNLHETMRFSYPRMLSPSFYVEEEDAHGCFLHYWSKRVGFTHYVIGQLKACARKFYNVLLEVKICREEKTARGCHIVYRLDFENSAYIPDMKSRRSSVPNAHITQFSKFPSGTFFQFCPFSLVYDSSMTITQVGPTLQKLFGHASLVNKKITSQFRLRRPQVDFTWENVLCLQKVVFELESILPVKHCSAERRDMSTSSSKTLLIKGQMKYVHDFQGVLFICTPLLNNIEEMRSVGLYINDLSMHDSSRDMVLAGWQHASRLEYSIEKQIDKSKQIAENMKQLDHWRHKSESLLYAMIPKSIAIRLKNGEDPINTCEAFDQVTIMFSYLIGFTDICANVSSAIQLLECINTVFTVFDNIADKYDVFKVETLGDPVYMIAGGVPDRNPNHAVNVAGLALELTEQVQTIKDPTGTHEKLMVRIGMHTGSVVAGVVGKRMPQYCLFGDTVNTASRMQTYSEAGRIHVSEPCHNCLKLSDYVTIYRGRVNIKGKGQMNTYWLVGTKNDADIDTRCQQLQYEHQNGRTSLPSSCNSTLALGIHHLRRKSEVHLFMPDPREVESSSTQATASSCMHGQQGSAHVSPTEKAAPHFYVGDEVCVTESVACSADSTRKLQHRFPQSDKISEDVTTAAQSPCQVKVNIQDDANTDLLNEDVFTEETCNMKVTPYKLKVTDDSNVTTSNDAKVVEIRQLRDDDELHSRCYKNINFSSNKKQFCPFISPCADHDKLIKKLTEPSVHANRKMSSEYNRNNYCRTEPSTSHELTVCDNSDFVGALDSQEKTQQHGMCDSRVPPNLPEIVVDTSVLFDLELSTYSENFMNGTSVVGDLVEHQEQPTTATGKRLEPTNSNTFTTADNSTSSSRLPRVGSLRIAVDCDKLAESRPPIQADCHKSSEWFECQSDDSSSSDEDQEKNSDALSTSQQSFDDQYTLLPNLSKFIDNSKSAWNQTHSVLLRKKVFPDHEFDDPNDVENTYGCTSASVQKSSFSRGLVTDNAADKDAFASNQDLPITMSYLSDASLSAAKTGIGNDHICPVQPEISGHVTEDVASLTSPDYSHTSGTQNQPCLLSTNHKTVGKVSDITNQGLRHMGLGIFPQTVKQTLTFKDTNKYVTRNDGKSNGVDSDSAVKTFVDMDCSLTANQSNCKLTNSDLTNQKHTQMASETTAHKFTHAYSDSTNQTSFYISTDSVNENDLMNLDSPGQTSSETDLDKRSETPSVVSLHFSVRTSSPEESDSLHQSSAVPDAYCKSQSAETSHESHSPYIPLISNSSTDDSSCVCCEGTPLTHSKRNRSGSRDSHQVLLPVETNSGEQRRTTVTDLSQPYGGIASETAPHRGSLQCQAKRSKARSGSQVSIVTAKLAEYGSCWCGSRLSCLNSCSQEVEPPDGYEDHKLGEKSTATDLANGGKKASDSGKDKDKIKRKPVTGRKKTSQAFTSCCMREVN